MSREIWQNFSRKTVGLFISVHFMFYVILISETLLTPNDPPDLE